MSKVTKTMAPIRHPAGALRYSHNRGSAELAIAQTSALLIPVLLRCSVAYKSQELNSTCGENRDDLSRLSRREAQPGPDEGSGCLSGASSASAGSGEHRREPEGRDSRAPFSFVHFFWASKRNVPAFGCGNPIHREAARIAVRIRYY